MTTKLLHRRVDVSLLLRLLCSAMPSKRRHAACSRSRRLVVWHNKFLRSSFFLSILFCLISFPFLVPFSLLTHSFSLTHFFAYFTDRPAFSKHPKRDEDVWVLLIKNARHSDTGLYVCEVNSEPAIKTFHSLAGKLMVARRQHDPLKKCSTKRSE